MSTEPQSDDRQEVRKVRTERPTTLKTMRTVVSDCRANPLLFGVQGANSV